MNLYTRYFISAVQFNYEFQFFSIMNFSFFNNPNDKWHLEVLYTLLPQHINSTCFDGNFAVLPYHQGRH